MAQATRKWLIWRIRLWVIVQEAERGLRKHLLRNVLSWTRKAGRCYTLHEVGYVELVVSISPIYLMFSWRTNFALLAGAEYCHPTNFTCSILTRLPYAAYCEWELPWRAVSLRNIPLHIQPRHYLSYPISSLSLALSVNHNIFNSTIPILATLHLRMEVSFRWIRQELE